MRGFQILKFGCLLICFANNVSVFSQLKKGVYLFDEGNVHHEIKVDKNYLIHTTYEKSPPKFIKTIGGFYAIENNMIQMNLEFNSDFQKDSLRTLDIAMKLEGDNLVLGEESKMVFELQKSTFQDLDSQWLFATRGPDKGQERRGETSARKTLKFLIDNRFQWIAYHTETFKFSGTGGGSYSTQDGLYTEHIEFFSRDNNRVGASLEFNYDLKENDWHHTGINSKGKPLYEIWQRRELVISKK